MTEDGSEWYGTLPLLGERPRLHNEASCRLLPLHVDLADFAADFADCAYLVGPACLDAYADVGRVGVGLFVVAGGLASSLDDPTLQEWTSSLDAQGSGASLP